MILSYQISVLLLFSHKQWRAKLRREKRRVRRQEQAKGNEDVEIGMCSKAVTKIAICIYILHDHVSLLLQCIQDV